MPLYEYECESCHEQFEVMQKFSDEPLTTHVKCGGKVHRVLSAPALQFKGSGWYITDYAKNQKSGDNGAAKKPDGAAGSSPDASESKAPASAPAETKSEAKSSSSDKKE